MRDTQISRPVLIALIGAILVGGFLFYKSTQSSEEALPPPSSQPAATGATGGSTGETGASGPTMTAAEKRAEARKQARKELIAAAEAAGMPLNVYEPLQNNKIVMIFIWEPEGADDQKVNNSVNFVKSERGNKLVVIREKIEKKSRYDGIAKVADITQTPGLVILYGEKADTWQGYIDGDSLNARITRIVGTAK